MGEGDSVDSAYEAAGASASESFSILGNETRLSILLALWQMFDPFGAENSVSFSELHDSVGSVDSGQFNYHLGKLLGDFVEHSDDGYRLTRTGLTFVQTVIASTASHEQWVGRTEVDEACPRCGATVTVTYENEEVTAACTECSGFFRTDMSQDGQIFQFEFPPAGCADRTAAGRLRAAFSFQLHRIEAMMDGVCPTCGGHVDWWLDVCEDHDAADGICDACGNPFIGLVRWRCRTCKASLWGPSWSPAMKHPAVVSFFYTHGIERDHSAWETAKRGFACTEELISREPLRLRGTVSVDDHNLHVTVDETLTVVEVRQSG